MTRMNMAQLSNQIQKTTQASNVTEATKKNKNQVAQTSFQEVFSRIQNEGELKFSKHAQNRVEERNIALDKSEMKRISDGVKKAESKGVRTTLVLMDNKAFIVSVDKKTIITTATEQQLKDNVFTNIDGAVIV